MMIIAEDRTTISRLLLTSVGSMQELSEYSERDENLKDSENEDSILLKPGDKTFIRTQIQVLPYVEVNCRPVALSNNILDDFEKEERLLKMIDPLRKFNEFLVNNQYKSKYEALQKIKRVERIMYGHFRPDHLKRKSHRLSPRKEELKSPMPIKSPSNESSEIIESIKNYVKPFKAFVPDTSGRNHHIQVTLTISHIDTSTNLIFVRANYLNLKSFEWIEVLLPTEFENYSKHKRAFFKYWYLLKHIFGSLVDKSLQTNIGETRLIIDAESLSYYSSSHVGIIKEIMGLVFDYLTLKFSIAHTTMGQKFVPVNSNTQALHLLKLYFYKKNQVFIKMLRGLQGITTYEYESRQRMYDFIRFKPNDFQNGSPNWSPKKRSAARKLNIYQRMMKQSTLDLQVPEVRSLESLDESKSATEWTDIVADSNFILPAGKLIDLTRPLAICVVQYEFDYYICELKVDSYVEDDVDSRRINNRGFRIDDFFTLFSISARGNEVIHEERIKLRELSDMIGMSLAETLTFIIKRVSRSIIPKNLGLRFSNAVINKASSIC